MPNSTINILVMLETQDRDAEEFRSRIASDAPFGDRVSLRFARGVAARDLLGWAEVVVTGGLSDEDLSRASNLKWAAFWSAGLDGKITPGFLEQNIQVTNASGVHGPNIAEHVFAFMLAFSRCLDVSIRAQQEACWTRSMDGIRSGMDELAGKTLGIVGLGRIGEALTQRAKAFEMRVIGTKRDVRLRYDSTIRPDLILPADELSRLMSESDHICIAAPYTPETHHLIDCRMLQLMKPGAYLYNISRGKTIDEAALIEALKEKRIAGAGLDVFETEPLPNESPLWHMDNVIITPHNSGQTPHYFARFASLFVDNLRNYIDGRPLMNSFRPERGY